jgi:hypothetical protein
VLLLARSFLSQPCLRNRVGLVTVIEYAEDGKHRDGESREVKEKHACEEPPDARRERGDSGDEKCGQACKEKQRARDDESKLPSPHRLKPRRFAEPTGRRTAAIGWRGSDAVPADPAAPSVGAAHCSATTSTARSAVSNADTTSPSRPATSGTATSKPSERFGSEVGEPGRRQLLSP